MLKKELLPDDFASLRDLYTKLKRELSEDPERRFGLSDEEVMQMHRSLDHTYEELITDNPKTQRIFEEALLWKG